MIGQVGTVGSCAVISCLISDQSVLKTLPLVRVVTKIDSITVDSVTYPTTRNSSREVSSEMGCVKSFTDRLTDSKRDEFSTRFGMSAWETVSSMHTPHWNDFFSNQTNSTGFFTLKGKCWKEIRLPLYLLYVEHPSCRRIELIRST